MSSLWVFIGGGVGSLCRYYTGIWLGHGGQFPLGTWIANILSCIILGILLAAASRQWLAPEYRFLLITGFCGGFSTFSTFSNEMLQMLRGGMWSMAAVYLLSSLAGGLLSVWLGMRIGGE